MKIIPSSSKVLRQNVLTATWRTVLEPYSCTYREKSIHLSAFVSSFHPALKLTLGIFDISVFFLDIRASFAVLENLESEESSAVPSHF